MRVGRVELTGSFFLLATWLNYLDRQSVVPLALLACALHELGHYWAIRLLGGDVRLVRLTAIGAEMVLSRPLGYGTEGAAALAGPGVNLLLALFFCRWEWGMLFSGLNLALGCFNLLPVGRLDGGRALYCTLALLTGPDTATRVGEWLDRLFTGGLLAVGLLLLGAGGNLTLFLAALWLAATHVRKNWEKKSAKRACHTGWKQVK